MEIETFIAAYNTSARGEGSLLGWVLIIGLGWSMWRDWSLKRATRTRERKYAAEIAAREAAEKDADQE